MSGSSRTHAWGLVRLVAAFSLVAGTALAAGSCSAPKPVATITYQLKPGTGQTVTSAELDTTVQVLQARLYAAGLGDVQVRAVPPDRVQVGLPKGADRQAVVAVTSPTGVLQFILLPPETYGTADAPGTTPIPAAGDTIDPALPAQFRGYDLDGSRIQATYDMNQGWDVGFAFTEPAAAQFETWTGQHVGDYFAIVVDGRVVTAPYIKAAISGGKGVISGAFTEQSAKNLAVVLRSGALPVPMTEISFESGW